jgi:hypothetical protein
MSSEPMNGSAAASSFGDPGDILRAARDATRHDRRGGTGETVGAPYAQTAAPGCRAYGVIPLAGEEGSCAASDL